jgi:hypothetical protein
LKSNKAVNIFIFLTSKEWIELHTSLALLLRQNVSQQQKMIQKKQKQNSIAITSECESTTENDSKETKTK